MFSYLILLYFIVLWSFCNALPLVNEDVRSFGNNIAESRVSRSTFFSPQYIKRLKKKSDKSRKAENKVPQPKGGKARYNDICRVIQGLGKCY